MALTKELANQVILAAILTCSIALGKPPDEHDWLKYRITLTPDSVSFKDGDLEIGGQIQFADSDGRKVSLPAGDFYLRGVIENCSKQQLEERLKSDSAWNNTKRPMGLGEINKESRFELQIRLNDQVHARSFVGAKREYALGVSLRLVREGEKSVRGPVAFATIVIEGPQKLSEHWRFIDACSDNFGHDHNPLRLVQAVNHLQKAGKAECIKALREYAELNSVSAQQRLLPLIRLLFSTGFATEYSLTVNSAQIVMEGDIPFNTCEGMAIMKAVGSISPLIARVEKHGTLREKPLRPVDDPLEAAEKLYKRRGEVPFSPKNRNPFGYQNRYLLQSWRMVEGIAGKNLPPDAFDTEEGWKALRDHIKKQGLRWDTERQCYH